MPISKRTGEGLNADNWRPMPAPEEEISSRDSVYDYIVNRPIATQNFQEVLKQLLADNCALLNAEFEDVKLFSNDCEPEPFALNAENRTKNRFPDILPFEHSRVKLSYTGAKSDYINASYTHGFSREREYIAAQNPMPNTRQDFWRMILDQKVPLVVMLAHVEELNEAECATYWPEENESVACGSIDVSHLSESEEDGYFVRHLKVDDGNSAIRLVKQMHFWKFTKFACPESTTGFLAFIKAVREHVALWSTAAPILVHSSTGLGRTGIFIALDWLTQAATSQSQLDVFNTVIRLRTDRMNMIQTEKQYQFIYECLADFLKSLPNAVASKTSCVVNCVSYANKLYVNVPVEVHSGADSIPLCPIEPGYEIPNM